MQFFHDNKVEPNIDLEKLCKEKNWFLIPYPENKIETLKSISKDGFTVKDGNNFFINYICLLSIYNYRKIIDFLKTIDILTISKENFVKLKGTKI